MQEQGTPRPKKARPRQRVAYSAARVSLATYCACRRDLPSRGRPTDLAGSRVHTLESPQMRDWRKLMLMDSGRWLPCAGREEYSKSKKWKQSNLKKKCGLY